MSLNLVTHKLSALYEAENHQKKVKNYFECHDFRSDDRLTLVNWMLACVDRYKASKEVFHLAVSLFDLFMSCKKLPRISIEKLQCIATCCLSVSFEMVYKGKTSDAQELVNLVSSVDPESTKEQLKMVRSLISEHFNIRKLIITPYTFFNYFRVILKLKPTHDLYCITNYILELSHYDDIICVRSQYKPSLIATAAIHTGLIALKLHYEWLSDLSVLTPYTGEEKELILLHKRMLELLKAASKETKYSSAQARYYREENNCVAQIDYSNV
ncbi:uncharacterized protein LOC106882405 [Octopus bimaculoides]|uniref:uncharacterized protein LOC106882405 n=1 Tax=Octopus bimaculoides TaxID=37653 RepID=UPI00071D71DD|nr:uncharacterized protein LOC106882405 [Octopus bimaculoides]|eukprot:XP_014788563.1 PREDICTED: cyclin-B2-1-like [Octopus bimaculoides]